MSYDVFTKDGEAAGKLTVTRVGPRTVFEFRSDLDPGVSRLVLICGSAVRSLGIPSQRAGGLYLKKTLTRLETEGWEIGDGLAALLVPAQEDISRLIPAEAPEEPPAPEPESVGSSATEEGPALPVMETAPPKPEEKPKPMPEPPEKPKPAPEEKPRPEPGPERMPEAAPGPEEKPEGPSECAPHEDEKPLPCPAPDREWREEPDPAKYFSDPALKASAARCSGALVREEGEGVCLAFPWTSSAPFPMLEIFRLCSTTSIGGTEYVTYRVRDGEPI